MLSKEENELITRTGPGTPGGEMFRRFWLPACLSSELPEPDGDPVRVRLLGEDLVAFRDSRGRVGLMPENCPHRGAALYFGRNEEGGLRCLYHGWKCDVDGNLLDTPCEPEGSVVRDRVKADVYPVHEQGGVIWAYLGPRGTRPPFPDFHWTLVPAPNRSIKKVFEECNYLQSLEGSMDRSHNPVLHDGRDIMRYPDEQAHLRQKPRRVEVVDTRYGLVHVATQPDPRDPGGGKAVSARPFVVPFTSYVTGPESGNWGDASCDVGAHPWGVHLFVPADDYSNWYYEIRYHPSMEVDQIEPDRFLVVGVDIDESGRKIKRRLENRYLQDRGAMRAKRTFSGIPGRPHEDMAMIESMGPIYDRTREHLGLADVVTIRLRQRLLDAVRAVQDGREPPGLDPTIPYDRLAVFSRVVPSDTPWQAAGMDIGDAAALPASALR
ncbi:MAG TPA: Rieske 2Fe-2S domain-containing protein [Chloroflexota bacterium]|nr:Rieske 2Fe-2S domain-containing protein [Chloroflexota bacterium]